LTVRTTKTALACVFFFLAQSGYVKERARPLPVSTRRGSALCPRALWRLDAPASRSVDS